MPRIRKESNRYWSKEDKVKIVLEVLEGHSSLQIAEKYDISSGMLRGWVIKYKKLGEDALENKKKPGNPLAKYVNKKQLTPIEALQYENMKLRIENERLKKGYQVKGDGSIVMFKK